MENGELPRGVAGLIFSGTEGGFHSDLMERRVIMLLIVCNGV